MLLFNQVGEDALDKHFTNYLPIFCIIGPNHTLEVLETEYEVCLVGGVYEVIDLSSKQLFMRLIIFGSQPNVKYLLDSVEVIVIVNTLEIVERAHHDLNE